MLNFKCCSYWDWNWYWNTYFEIVAIEFAVEFQFWNYWVFSSRFFVAHICGLFCTSMASQQQAYPDWEFIWWYGMCAVSKIHVVTTKMKRGENKKKRNCQFLKHAFKCSLLSMISCHWFFDFPLFSSCNSSSRLMMSVTWVFSANRSKNVAPKRELDFFTETSFPLSLPSTLGFERTLVGYTSLCVL